MTWLLFSETSTDMAADLILFNQTCNDAWAAGRGESKTDMRTGPIILEQTCPLIQCNSTQHSCKFGSMVTYIIAGAM